MARIKVIPDGRMWVVKRGNRTISNHRLKRRAKDAAKREASTGDRIEIRGQNGAVQTVKTK